MKSNEMNEIVEDILRISGTPSRETPPIVGAWANLNEENGIVADIMGSRGHDVLFGKQPKAKSLHESLDLVKPKAPTKTLDECMRRILGVTESIVDRCVTLSESQDENQKVLNNWLLNRIVPILEGVMDAYVGGDAGEGDEGDEDEDEGDEGDESDEGEGDEGYDEADEAKIISKCSEELEKVIERIEGSLGDIEDSGDLSQSLEDLKSIKADFEELEKLHGDESDEGEGDEGDGEDDGAGQPWQGGQEGEPVIPSPEEGMGESKLGEDSDNIKTMMDKARDYSNSKAPFASLKDLRHWLTNEKPNATWSEVKEFMDESNEEEQADANLDVSPEEKKYGVDEACAYKKKFTEEDPEPSNFDSESVSTREIDEAGIQGKGEYFLIQSQAGINIIPWADKEGLEEVMAGLPPNANVEVTLVTNSEGRDSEIYTGPAEGWSSRNEQNPPMEACQKKNEVTEESLKPGTRVKVLGRHKEGDSTFSGKEGEIVDTHDVVGMGKAYIVRIDGDEKRQIDPSLVVKINNEMSEASENKVPSAEQMQALRDFAKKYGNSWKAELRRKWSTGGDEKEPNSAYLRQVRNQFGPNWLASFKLEPKDPSVEEGENSLEVSSALKESHDEYNLGDFLDYRLNISPEKKADAMEKLLSNPDFMKNIPYEDMDDSTDWVHEVPESAVAMARSLIGEMNSEDGQEVDEPIDEATDIKFIAKWGKLGIAGELSNILKAIELRGDAEMLQNIGKDIQDLMQKHGMKVYDKPTGQEMGEGQGSPEDAYSVDFESVLTNPEIDPNSVESRIEDLRTKYSDRISMEKMMEIEKKVETRLGDAEQERQNLGPSQRDM